MISIDFTNQEIEFWVDDKSCKKVNTHLIEKKLRFGFFNFYKNNKIEIISVRNNLVKELKFDQDDFYCHNTKIEDNIIEDENQDNSWTHFTRFERRLDLGIWKFELEIQKINNDKSGLAIGFINGDSEECSLDYIQRGLLGINVTNNNNMVKVVDYVLANDQKIECKIDSGKEITFKVDGQLVLKSAKLDVLDPNLKNIKLAIFNYYPENQIKINWIKTTNSIGLKSKDIPETPIFKNKLGEILVKTKK